MKPEDVVVIGGGVAGLAAALTLADAGRPPLLLEAQDALGGRARAHAPWWLDSPSGPVALPTEHGVHAWWESYRTFDALLARAGALGALRPAREQTLVWDEGRRVRRLNIGRATQDTALPSPLHLAALLAVPGFLPAVRPREFPGLLAMLARNAEVLAYDARDEALRRRYEGLSAADWMAGMPAVFRAFLKSLTRSGFFDEASNVSAAALFESLQHYVYAQKTHQRMRYARSTTWASALRPLWEACEAQGGRLALSTTVTGLERAGGLLRLDTTAGRIVARAVIVTVERPAAARLWDASSALREVLPQRPDASGLGSAAVRTAWTGRLPRGVGDGGVFAGSFLADNFFVLSELQNEARTWAERTGGAVLECHVYAQAQLARLDDAALARQVAAELRRAFPSLGAPLGHHVTRNPANHTTYPLGAEAHGTAPPPVDSPLQLAGDWIAADAQCFFMERAARTGWLAASRTLALLGAAAPRPPSEPPAPLLTRTVRAAAQAAGRRGVGVSRRGAATMDVVIVGAGPAGAATALFLLAREPNLAGRVRLIDKARFPRDKTCAGAVGGRAERLLAEVGVTLDVPGVPIDGMDVQWAGGQAARRVGALGRVVRRRDFDAALVAQAQLRGAELLEGCALEGLTVHEDGVELETSAGRLRAELVVGADGLGSRVRRALGLPLGELLAQAVEVDTAPIASDPARDTLRFWVGDFPGYAWDFPTLVDGAAATNRGVYALAPEGRVDVQRLLGERLAALGVDAPFSARRAFLVRGVTLRAPLAVPRVLLVGEAAGADALLGEGIAQAVQYGALAGDYLARAWGRRAFGFEDWRRTVWRSSLGADSLVRLALLPLSQRAGLKRLGLGVLGAAPWLLQGTASAFAGRLPWQGPELG